MCRYLTLCCVVRDVLKEKGSAVDAAIATLFCLGVHDMHSAGVGGGFFMVVYDTCVTCIALSLPA